MMPNQSIPTTTTSTKNIDQKKDENPMFSMVVNIIRWIVYSFIMFLLLLPFELTIAQKITGGLILGWFGAALNEIIIQLRRIFINN